MNEHWENMIFETYKALGYKDEKILSILHKMDSSKLENVRRSLENLFKEWAEENDYIPRDRMGDYLAEARMAKDEAYD